MSNSDDGVGGDRVPGAAEEPGCAEADRLSCSEALVRVQEFLDGELGDVPAEQVRRHFEVCESCYPHLCFERAFLDAVKRCGGATAPAELRAKIAALVERADSEG